MHLRTAFNRERSSKVLVRALILGLLQILSPAPAVAASCTPASSAIQDVYTVLTFTSTSTCDWTVPTGVTSIDVFMVGAGGGGGGDGGGGGGGGAAISRSAFAVTAGSSLALTVGTGGAPSVWSTGYTGTDGSASTLVRTSPSTTLTANGGIKGGLGPSGAPGAGGAAVNGGFAGGRGGTNSIYGNAKGGDGFTGISNYFSGSKIEYGGGGGGGSYYGSSSFTETLGKSGGGNGGASGSGNNQPGNPGRTNSGGGGGGGSANSPQQAGGRGADGVILIRYATDARYEFPSSLASSLSYRYLPGDLQNLDSTRLGWIDSSGGNSSSLSFRSSPTIGYQEKTDNSLTVRSSKRILTVSGTVDQGVYLPSLPTNYTLFHLARYQRGGSAGRIVSATGTNWLSGFWSGNQGAAWHGDAGSWLMPSLTGTDYSWQLSTDQTSLYKSNGSNITKANYTGTNPASGFGINVGWSNTEYSTWQVADLMVFNRSLTLSEISQVENYMSLVYGLASPGNPVLTPPSSNETGLLVKLDASNSTYLSDTSTVWKDSSGNSRNANISAPTIGVIANYGTVTCTSPRYSSFNGGSLSFNGSNDCAFVSGSSSLNLETYTVEVWVNPRLGVTQTGGAAIITTPYNHGENVNFTLTCDGTGKVSGGFYNPALGSWQSTSATSVPSGEWTHLALVSSGGSLSYYVNGELRDSITVTTKPAGSSRGVVLGRRWDGTQHFNGLLSQVKILNTGLTSAQVRQNYYASSSRYSTTASGVASLSGTYGEVLTQVFTASSGIGTKTLSFSPNNRSGISWDTSTANSAVLRISNPLNAGTYYETITATDSATASTSLGLTITVNKARQASLSIGQYNAFVGTSTYPINVYGGSSGGAITRSLTDSGTAGCALASSMFLTAAREGACLVQAVRAGDSNWYSETATATIYWVRWNDAYATRVPSTPTEIVLNHKTEIIRHSYETLTVTSYTDTATVPNTITSARPGQTIRILGLGFVSTDTTSQATFTDNEYADRTGLTDDYIQVVVPTGAVTGPVIVDTLKGQAIGPTLTILSP